MVIAVIMRTIARSMQMQRILTAQNARSRAKHGRPMLSIGRYTHVTDAHAHARAGTIL